eukprot:6675612-Prymnesium_polylepis.1
MKNIKTVTYGGRTRRAVRWREIRRGRRNPCVRPPSLALAAQVIGEPHRRCSSWHPTVERALKDRGYYGRATPIGRAACERIET